MSRAAPSLSSAVTELPHQISLLGSQGVPWETKDASITSVTEFMCLASKEKGTSWRAAFHSLTPSAELMLMQREELLQLLGSSHRIEPSELRELEEVGCGSFARLRRALFRGKQTVVKHFHRNGPNELLEVLLLRYFGLAGVFLRCIRL